MGLGFRVYGSRVYVYGFRGFNYSYSMASIVSYGMVYTARYSTGKHSKLSCMI